MHKNGRVWDSLNLNLLAECKLWRTGVKNATWMIFLEKSCAFICSIFNSSHKSPWLQTVLWTATPISSLDYKIGKCQKWKAAGFRDLPYLHRDTKCIYPFYSQVLTPVIPINTRHLSHLHGGTRAAPHQFHSWVTHQTSHLYFQTHTYTVTHVSQKPPPHPSRCLNGLISMLIWDLCLILLTELTHFKAFPWLSRFPWKKAVW